MTVAEQILAQKDDLRDELELAAARLDVKKTELVRGRCRLRSGQGRRGRRLGPIVQH